MAKNNRQPEEESVMPDQGQGEGGEPQEDWGLSPTQENRLISQALRWNTEQTPEELEENLASPQKNIRDIALAVTHRNMFDESARVRNGAVKNLIAMEKMNQEDQKPAKQVLHAHVVAKPEPDRWTALAEQLGLDGFLEEVQPGESEINSDPAESNGEATEEDT